MEQRLDATYLRPQLLTRAGALAVAALGVGAGVFLAAWGVSFLWRYTPPEIAVRIANPEVRLTQEEALTVRQDKPFVLAPPAPFELKPATVTVKVDSLPFPPINAPTPRADGAVITRNVTVFTGTAHGLGQVTTGWEFIDGRGGRPVHEYCYYSVMTGNAISKRVDLAFDRRPLPGAALAGVPEIDTALTKCVWFNDGAL